MSICIDYNNSNFNKCQSEVYNLFQDRKSDSLVLSDLYSDLGFFKKSDLVRSCGNFLEFHLSEENVYLEKANFCKDRLCPMCNWRKSKKVFVNVSNVMDQVQNLGYRFLFLTLTVRNPRFCDLKETLDMFQSGWRKLYKSKKLKGLIYGSFHCMEITVNEKEGTFHPHIHCILAVKESYFDGNHFISQRKWSELWSNCCNLDYNPVCFIETVKSGKLDVSGGGKQKTFKSAVKEVSKYLAKGSDYLSGSYDKNLVKVRYLVEALDKRRICSFTGVFKEVAKQLRLEELENGDMVHIEGKINSELKSVIVRYQWKIGIGYEILGVREKAGADPEVIRPARLSPAIS